ncbi:MAG: hypothetical protein ACK4UY_07375 [Dietzia sp.]
MTITGGTVSATSTYASGIGSYGYSYPMDNPGALTVYGTRQPRRRPSPMAAPTRLT